MQGNAEVVLGVFGAVEERDREKLFELYHEDVEFHEAPSLPYGGSMRGRKHWESNSRLRLRRRGSARGDRFSRPSRSGAWIYEVRDGKFARAQMFHYDTAAVVDFLERVASAPPGIDG